MIVIALVILALVWPVYAYIAWITSEVLFSIKQMPAVDREGLAGAFSNIAAFVKGINQSRSRPVALSDLIKAAACHLGADNPR